MKDRELIGRGATAEVFWWGEGRVCKLFRPGYPERAVQQEYENACAVQTLDFPKPGVYGMVKEADRLGILYGYVRGEPLLDVLARQGAPRDIRLMGQLHRRVLSYPGDGLPDYRDRLCRDIAAAVWLDGAARRAALTACRALPEGGALCHGDFHPGNILCAQKVLVLLDFQDLCRGPALYDIARTVFLLRDAASPAGRPAPDNADLHRLRSGRTAEYLACMGMGEDVLTPYLRVIAASRADAPR